MYSFEHYIHFVDGKVTEDNLPKEVVVNDTTITFKYGEPIQLHVVVDVKNEMSLHYVFEDNVHAEVIETRHVEENGVLNRTFINGAYSHVNFFNENEGTGKNTYLDEGNSSHDSMLQLGYSELSDASIEASYTFELDGEGADVRLRMAALSKNKEKKHYKVHIKHNAPHTTGIMDNYGVAKDEAHLVIDGIGTITNGQNGSASHQTNKIIVFDPKCYASANPFLYIDEYDVQASHAAGVGKMDEEHLYYLQSRGLTKRQAMQLITYGYLMPVVEVVDNQMIKERFELALSKVGA
ncbi:SufB/SufD family protein [Catenibacterium sp.]|uniref:SufB/SufD family protein n=1 Tax=Catenibacterium sp. TaxID=2049022 RepID=UPI003FD8B6AC